MTPSKKDITPINGDNECTMNALKEKLLHVSRILPHIPRAHLLTESSVVLRIRYRNCSRANEAGRTNASTVLLSLVRKGTYLKKCSCWTTCPCL